jgi:hypothetical protein
MIVQCIAIPGVLAFRIAQDAFPEREGLVRGAEWLAIGLVWAALAITVWSGIGYVRKAAVHLREGL